jgi:outer membrane immunogenic protein
MGLIMRRFQSAALAVVAVVGFASLASAADMPVKAIKAPAAVASPIWSGFYVGVNAGGIWGRTNTDNSFISDANPFAQSIALAAGQGTSSGGGFIGGAQIGYNWQVANWVTGLEADFQGLSLKQTRTSPIVASGAGTGQDFDEIKHNWLATFRARGGYAWGSTLLYVTGGAAVSDTKFSRTQSWSFGDFCPIDPQNGFADCHVGSASKTTVGPVVGAGLEYALSGNWRVRAEYLHVWLPGVSFVSASVAGPTQQFNQIANTSKIDIARLALNYRLGP